MTQLVDANIFIHLLVRPDDPEGRTQHDACRAFFERVDRGDEDVASTEACLAEIFHVLTGKQQYRRPIEDAVVALRSITNQRGIRVRHQNLYPQALDVLDRHPRLGFEDALLVAHALATGMQIVSYDRDFDRIEGVVRVEPDPVAAPT